MNVPEYREPIIIDADATRTRIAELEAENTRLAQLVDCQRRQRERIALLAFEFDEVADRMARLHCDLKMLL
jgi:hypothetical protein